MRLSKILTKKGGDPTGELIKHSKKKVYMITTFSCFNPCLMDKRGLPSVILFPMESIFDYDYNNNNN